MPRIVPRALTLNCFALLTAATLVTAACSAHDARGMTPNGVTSLDSDSGAFRVNLASAPAAVPVRGKNQLELRVMRVDSGDGAEGLKLTMLPFMPAMGHGSPAVPDVFDRGDGHYHVDDVVLTMPGLWELQTTIEAPEHDHFTFRFEIE